MKKKDRNMTYYNIDGIGVNQQTLPVNPYQQVGNNPGMMPNMMGNNPGMMSNMAPINNQMPVNPYQQVGNNPGMMPNMMPNNPGMMPNMAPINNQMPINQNIIGGAPNLNINTKIDLEKRLMQIDDQIRKLEARVARLESSSKYELSKSDIEYTKNSMYIM